MIIRYHHKVSLAGLDLRSFLLCSAQAGPKGPAHRCTIEFRAHLSETSRTQAVSMDFYVPGAQGPPYTFSFMDPPIQVVYYGFRS